MQDMAYPTICWHKDAMPLVATTESLLSISRTDSDELMFWNRLSTSLSRVWCFIKRTWAAFALCTCYLLQSSTMLTFFRNWLLTAETSGTCGTQQKRKASSSCACSCHTPIKKKRQSVNGGWRSISSADDIRILDNTIRQTRLINTLPTTLPNAFSLLEPISPVLQLSPTFCTPMATPTLNATHFRHEQPEPAPTVSNAGSNSVGTILQRLSIAEASPEEHLPIKTNITPAQIQQNVESLPIHPNEDVLASSGALFLSPRATTAMTATKHTTSVSSESHVSREIVQAEPCPRTSLFHKNMIDRYSIRIPQRQFIGLCAYLCAVLRLGYPINTSELDGFIHLYRAFQAQLPVLEQEQIRSDSNTIMSYHEWYLNNCIRARENEREIEEIRGKSFVLTENTLRDIWFEHPHIFLRTWRRVYVVAKVANCDGEEH